MPFCFLTLPIRSKHISYLRDFCRKKISEISGIFSKIFLSLLNLKIRRSSRPEVFCKKAVLRNFAKFTGKHLCQSLFLNKVLGHRCFPVNFAKFLRTAFFIEHLW